MSTQPTQIKKTNYSIVLTPKRAYKSQSKIEYGDKQYEKLYPTVPNNEPLDRVELMTFQIPDTEDYYMIRYSGFGGLPYNKNAKFLTKFIPVQPSGNFTIVRCNPDEERQPITHTLKEIKKICSGAFKKTQPPKTDIDNYLNDPFLMAQCKLGTACLMEEHNDIDRVCKFIKKYQLQYIVNYEKTGKRMTFFECVDYVKSLYEPTPIK